MSRVMAHMLSIACLQLCSFRLYGQDPTRLSSRELQMRITEHAGSQAASVSRTVSPATVSIDDLSVPASARNKFDKGRELLLKAHKSSESIGYFRKAIEFAPRYSEAHFLLGVAYIDILEYHEAEAALMTATAVNSKNGRAYLALGYSLIEQRRYAEAEEPLLRGVEFDPNNSRGFYDLGRSYYALNRPQEAQKYLRKAITLAPKVAAMHALLANVLLCTGDMEGARREFEEYAHLDPNGNVSVD